MSDFNYRAISDRELVKRLEKGEMQTNSDLYAESIGRMEEKGILYNDTPQDEERWKADIASSVRRK
ncbi:hypothetical protein H6G17_22080 [Chroococcidiopsis sp. FACHB-1243]|uniref:hypothetical protein n=1 Tax=Chroococcidiopsis sp. [FACHB-1243] TaxID=2692781 RepID=UPI001781D178|nr:hypothetical protein [Chroococcidiopsis sp. [FACHB-1243]]MBD2308165.1 hypothetical protein [Chroococcidiopsis sp. [FACHB-1243]]